MIQLQNTALHHHPIYDLFSSTMASNIVDGFTATPRGPTLWILFDVIRNLLESWLDSKIPDVIPEIPVYQIRRKYIT